MGAKLYQSIFNEHTATKLLIALLIAMLVLCDLVVFGVLALP